MVLCEVSKSRRKPTLQQRGPQQTEQVGAELRADPLVTAFPADTIHEHIMLDLSHVTHQEVSEPQVLCGQVEQTTQLQVTRLYPPCLHLFVNDSLMFKVYRNYLQKIGGLKQRSALSPCSQPVVNAQLFGVLANF